MNKLIEILSTYFRKYDARRQDRWIFIILPNDELDNIFYEFFIYAKKIDEYKSKSAFQFHLSDIDNLDYYHQKNQK